MDVSSHVGAGIQTGSSVRAAKVLKPLSHLSSPTNVFLKDYNWHFCSLLELEFSLPAVPGTLDCSTKHVFN